MNYTIPLLPYKAKIIGGLAIFTGVTLMYISLFIGYPEWLNFYVFALADFTRHKSFFTVIQNNLIDELGVVSIILGLLFIFFSRSKKEKPRNNRLRVKAMVISVWVTSVLWIVIVFTFYGMAVFLVFAMVFTLFLLCCNLLYCLFMVIDNPKNYILPD